jgi:D-alanyl-D-alanine carboxypeptidase
MTRSSWKGSPRLVVLALATMIAVTVLAACGGTEKQTVSADLSAQLQTILDNAVKSPKTVFPGTAMYVSQPELGTWSGAAGEANIDPATPMKAGDTFRAGSIMKPFISVVILQLVEEGKLALDDPLPAVLPGRVTARVANADQITVRMLLNHTSGIPDYTGAEFDGKVLADPQRRWKVEEFLALAAAEPRPFAPGEGWSYSNTNYNLLGLVIEEATHQPWRTAVRERVIDRLGLEHTSLPEPGHGFVGSDAAHGYQLVNGKLLDITDVDPSMADAAGGDALVTTTEDLAHFLKALLAGELFEQAETLDEMLTFHKASNDSGPIGYGLGIERYAMPGGGELIGHVGSTAGYFAVMGHVPAQNIDLSLVMTNNEYSPSVLMPALKRMVAATSGFSHSGFSSP